MSSERYLKPRDESAEKIPVKKRSMMIPQKYRKPTAVFLLLSMLLHVGLFIFFSLQEAPKPPTTTEVVEIEYRPTEELTPPAPEDENRAQQPAPQVRNQIVEQEKQINDEKPEDARFLSAFNQTVVKETRAVSIGQFNNTAKGGAPDEGSHPDHLRHR